MESKTTAAATLKTNSYGEVIFETAKTPEGEQAVTVFDAETGSPIAIGNVHKSGSRWYASGKSASFKTRFEAVDALLVTTN